MRAARPHPGRGNRRGRSGPRGRRASPAAREAVARLLGPAVPRRDLLLEYLHALQDQHGHLAADHLAALAETLGIAQAEVYETATFYAHFDVVAGAEPRPPAVTVRVCDSLSCELAGAEALLADLHGHLPPAQVRVLRAPCMGRCDKAPVVAVGHQHLTTATTQDVMAAAAGSSAPVPDGATQTLAGYRQGGGYRLLDACRRGEREPREIIDTVAAAGLRGMGGAGFPAAAKWEAVRSEPGPRLMVVNADEGEPGTFKDLLLLTRSPHQVLEGALLAAWVVGAERCWIYLRDEYPEARAILLAAVAELESAGLIGADELELRRGAGAYVCGEESAMIESIEGRRGYPRERPPYVSVRGLFGRPTLVNNVETLYWLPEILTRGGGWFHGQGRRGGHGMRCYSVSGRVARPGVHIAPAGISARELIDEHCGGMAPGHTLRAFLPGGASGGILPARLADAPLDFGALDEHGAFVGSGAIIVLSDRDDLIGVARNLLRFFAAESCGQCTPCRDGTAKMLQLIEQERWDVTLLRALSDVMRDASICGLGQAAPNPVSALLTHFPEIVHADGVIARG